jgi:hypothetical protein
MNGLAQSSSQRTRPTLVVAFVLTIMALVGSAAAFSSIGRSASSDAARGGCQGLDLAAVGSAVSQTVITADTAEVTPSESVESVESAGACAAATPIVVGALSTVPHAVLQVHPTCEGCVPVLRFRLRAFPSRGPPLA